MRKPNDKSGNGKKGTFRRNVGEKKVGRSDESRAYSDRPDKAARPLENRKQRAEGSPEKPRRSSTRGGGSLDARKPAFAKYRDKDAGKFNRLNAKPDRKKAEGEKISPRRKTKPRNASDRPENSFERNKIRSDSQTRPSGDHQYGFDKFAARSGKSRGAGDTSRTQKDSGGDQEPTSRRPRPTGIEGETRGGFEQRDYRKKPGAKFDSNARKYGAKKSAGAGLPERKVRLKERDDDSIKRVKFDEFEEGKVFSNKDKKTQPIQRKPSKNKTKYKKSVFKNGPQTGDGLIRLNKYLSNAGIASRREADTLIQSGVVKVNGVVVDQLGYKIHEGDKVTYGDAPVKGERKVYLLLNKPKDYITTVDDPQERKTVMELVNKACKERIYPVGRLDRNTTGLLLFTNDGELTTKLTHPKFGVKKVYHVSLNKGLKPEDFRAISEGIELEDGLVKADDVAFVGEGKKEIGIEIHSGRNRIVRRIFEHLGYDVLKLDRVVFAGLTKKDLPRGKHRFLTGKEISFLQMIS
jgi:23S rRNA pseudouridine2605 synthase